MMKNVLKELTRIILVICCVLFGWRGTYVAAADKLADRRYLLYDELEILKWSWKDENGIPKGIRKEYPKEVAWVRKFAETHVVDYRSQHKFAFLCVDCGKNIVYYKTSDQAGPGYSIEPGIEDLHRFLDFLVYIHQPEVIEEIRNTAIQSSSPEDATRLASFHLKTGSTHLSELDKANIQAQLRLRLETEPRFETLISEAGDPALAEMIGRTTGAPRPRSGRVTMVNQANGEVVLEDWENREVSLAIAKDIYAEVKEGIWKGKTFTVTNSRILEGAKALSYLANEGKQADQISVWTASSLGDTEATAPLPIESAIKFEVMTSSIK